MKAILTSGQMARCDQYTIDELGTPGLELMEQAAASAVDELLRRVTSGELICVMTGAGNNGGDGFAMARLLIQQDYDVHTFCFFPRTRYQGDALTNYNRLVRMGAPVTHVDDRSSFRVPSRCAWIVDALFGTGLSRPLEAGFKDLVQAINRHPAQVLAVDLPSGLCGDHGERIGPSVRATVTVTLGTLKLAHVVTPACGDCGEVIVKDIGIKLAPDVKVGCFLLEREDYQWSSRPSISHKGSYGTLAIVGGTRGMEGACNLASLAALRFGAGKVRILTDYPGSPRFRHDSVMVGPFPEQTDLEAYDALVVGPGMGRGEEMGRRMRDFDPGAKPTVWDADGLYWLAAHSRRLVQEFVLTPHPGEAARLLDWTVGEVQARRVEAVRALLEGYPGGWILLKGFRSLIINPEGVIHVLGTGNPALATAGTGDVLAGMIGALLAQGLSAGDAVTLAALRHGMAADRWTVSHPDHSMIAEDLIHDLVH